MSALTIFYFTCAIILALYGVNIHILTHLFKRRYLASREADAKFLAEFYQVKGDQPKVEKAQADLPQVTTQLPVYNELNVVERLIDAAAAFTYPEGKHEIQVLDDSTDESCEIIAEKVRKLRQQGVNIHHIRREERSGFKAGALKNGLESAMGEYVAIFDADFVPHPDFLLRSMPFFLTDEKLGIVQARWGHLNDDESLVTRLQAIGINGHFAVEQAARSSNNLFMNFNGTAGVIRKQAIIEAGNWQGDTLTEDMDLSYRMQLCGWKCHFSSDLVAPAEIPSDLNSFKSQQFRWAKGSTQTAIKLMPRIFRSAATPFKKFQAFMHMTHYFIHPLMLILALLAPVILFQPAVNFPGAVWLIFGILLLVGCSGPSRMYLASEKALGNTYGRTLLYLPLMISFGCGLAMNNSRAVMEAVLGKSSDFVRTPKSGAERKKSYSVKEPPLFIIEILLGLWCLFGVFLYFDSHYFLIGHFMLLYSMGFLSIGCISWQHSRRGCFS